LTILHKCADWALMAASAASSRSPWAWGKRQLTGLIEPRIVGPGCLHGVRVKHAVIAALGHDLRPALYAIPLIRELERRFAGIEIDVLVASRAAADVFDGFQSVSRVLVAPSAGSGIFAWARAITRLWAARYDLAIDLGEPGEAGRALLAVVRPRASLGVPAADNSGWSFAMFSAPRDPARLPVYLLRRALVCEEQLDETRYPSATLCLTLRERRAGAAVVRCLAGGIEGSEAQRPTIGVMANASSAPMLTPAWWECFLDELKVLWPDCAIVEITTGDDCNHLGNSVAHYSSTEPRSLVAVFSHLSGLIVTDPKLGHLASAGGTATVALHSINDSSAYLACGPQCRGITIESRSPQSAAQATVRALAASAVEVALRTSHSSLPASRQSVHRAATTSSVDRSGRPSAIRARVPRGG
jgi:hypothetical protein